MDSSEGAPLMILEYMPYGDLQNFLKRHTLVLVQWYIGNQYTGILVHRYSGKMVQWCTGGTPVHWYLYNERLVVLGG